MDLVPIFYYAIPLTAGIAGGPGNLMEYTIEIGQFILPQTTHYSLIEKVSQHLGRMGAANLLGVLQL